MTSTMHHQHGTAWIAFPTPPTSPTKPRGITIQRQDHHITSSSLTQKLDVAQARRFHLLTLVKEKNTKKYLHAKRVSLVIKNAKRLQQFWRLFKISQILKRRGQLRNPLPQDKMDSFEDLTEFVSAQATRHAAQEFLADARLPTHLHSTLLSSKVTCEYPHIIHATFELVAHARHVVHSTDNFCSSPCYQSLVLFQNSLQRYGKELRMFKKRDALMMSSSLLVSFVELRSAADAMASDDVKYQESRTALIREAAKIQGRVKALLSPIDYREWLTRASQACKQVKRHIKEVEQHDERSALVRDLLLDPTFQLPVPEGNRTSPPPPPQVPPEHVELMSVRAIAHIAQRLGDLTPNRSDLRHDLEIKTKSMIAKIESKEFQINDYISAATYFMDRVTELQSSERVDDTKASFRTMMEKAANYNHHHNNSSLTWFSALVPEFLDLLISTVAIIERDLANFQLRVLSQRLHHDEDDFRAGVAMIHKVPVGPSTLDFVARARAMAAQCGVTMFHAKEAFIQLLTWADEITQWPEIWQSDCNHVLRLHHDIKRMCALAAIEIVCRQFVGTDATNIARICPSLQYENFQLVVSKSSSTDCSWAVPQALQDVEKLRTLSVTDKAVLSSLISETCSGGLFRVLRRRFFSNVVFRTGHVGTNTNDGFVEGLKSIGMDAFRIPAADLCQRAQRLYALHFAVYGEEPYVPASQPPAQE